MELANAGEWHGDLAAFAAALREMTPTEEFHAYPRYELMAALRERGATDDAHAAATLCRRITRACLPARSARMPATGHARRGRRRLLEILASGLHVHGSPSTPI